MQQGPATAWLAVLRQQRAAARQTSREVPKLLADRAFGLAQAVELFEALESQSSFVEKLAQVLESGGYEPDVVLAAERLEGVYGDLAAAVGDKVKRLRS
jgi:hypothetical protein